MTCVASWVACKRALFTSDACKDVGRFGCAVPDDAGLTAATLATGAGAPALVQAFVFATCGLLDACCKVCAMAALEVSARLGWQMASRYKVTIAQDTARAIWPSLIYSGVTDHRDPYSQQAFWAYR